MIGLIENCLASATFCYDPKIPFKEGLIDIQFYNKHYYNNYCKEYIFDYIKYIPIRHKQYIEYSFISINCSDSHYHKHDYCIFDINHCEGDWSFMGVTAYCNYNYNTYMIELENNIKWKICRSDIDDWLD